jgi:hypothetical protein
LWDKDFTRLPFDVIFQILEEGETTPKVYFEETIWRVVERYCNANPSLTSEQRQQLIDCVKLPLLPSSVLTQLKSSPLISKDLLLKASLKRLSLIDNPSTIE